MLGWPLDRIIHVQVWATDTIPGDLPPMLEFIASVDKTILQRWGLRVEHIRGRMNYEQGFYKVRQGDERPGTIYGWPYQRGAWCNSRLKQHILEKIPKDAIQYVGIAVDEPSRFHSLSSVKRSPLVEAGWTEAYCRKWAEENDLLAPTYTTSLRSGCWFCHNQGVEQLRLLRKGYPELWALMLKWDTDSPVIFKANGHTVHDYDRRFMMEDEGSIPTSGRLFRWKMLDQKKEE